MQIRILIASGLTFVALALTAATSHVDPAGMLVHEWGTFLAMNGSDGVSLDGMYHEEHALPAFVHTRSRDQLRLRSAVIKGETPVIYFYTSRPERVRVEVSFPGGFWTQWYPQAAAVGPSLLATGAPLRARDGRIGWTVDVVPPTGTDVSLPAAAPDALWNHARLVDAAYVRATDPTRPGTPGEWERFIFYRGLGEAPLPLQAQVANGHLVVRAAGGERLAHLFIVRVEDGRAAYSYIPALDGGRTMTLAIPSLAGAEPLDRFVDRIGDDLAGRLRESGLFEKEARAMVNTWRSSYFGSDGLRLLFVLPQAWTDRFIPLRISPVPSDVVRVMVGRVEVLTPERERRAEDAVRSLASLDPATRAAAFTWLLDQGRYVEPILRRALETSSNDEVRMLARRLLLTDFVTELRATLSASADDATRAQDRVYVRAQLASLLREVGLVEGARQEGRMALAVLEQMPTPDITDHRSRPIYRALARAHEGAGNDAQALKWYAEFVRFGSQAVRCAGCHTLEGPREPSFFRDWWAGAKYAEYAAKTGRLDALIASHEATLSTSPGDVYARLALAYLARRRGDSVRAQALWSLIDPPSPGAGMESRSRK
jgi:hypothetical protein